MPTHRLQIENLGPIKQADLSLGDLTVLVGPQATGKTIALELLKLALDTGYIQEQLDKHGISWHRNVNNLLDTYFGEGMRSIWRDGESKVISGRTDFDLSKSANRRQKDKSEQLFYIPAQRVVILRDGWPRPFTDYSVGDPFVVRDFSEKIRLLLEQDFSESESLFPQENRLKRSFRQMLQQAIFSNFMLSVDKSRMKRRLVLGSKQNPNDPLPQMVWSAGQREFVPLLLGLYFLMPPSKVTKKKGIEWVVIEEPEMGLHPKAISVLMLLVMELLHRGYRVCISTHSPQIIELVWTINLFKKEKISFEHLMDIFMTKKDPSFSDLPNQLSKKRVAVYYFDPKTSIVSDISDLDPFSEDASISSWGGLTEFSSRVSEVVSSNLQEQS